MELCARKEMAEKKLTECHVEMEEQDDEENMSVSNASKVPDVSLPQLGNISRWIELARK